MMNGATARDDTKRLFVATHLSMFHLKPLKQGSHDTVSHGSIVTRPAHGLEGVQRPIGQLTLAVFRQAAHKLTQRRLAIGYRPLHLGLLLSPFCCTRCSRRTCHRIERRGRESFLCIYIYMRVRALCGAYSYSSSSPTSGRPTDQPPLLHFLHRPSLNPVATPLKNYRIRSSVHHRPPSRSVLGEQKRPHP